MQKHNYSTQKILCKNIFLVLALFSFVVKADDKIVGHMKPLPNEILPKTITLQCGLTIIEWRGSTHSKQHVKTLNDYCNLAKENFKPFLNKHNLQATDINTITFTASLIPDGRVYRTLNDTAYRFVERQEQDDVWGYTSYDENHLFMISNFSMSNFATIFTHEIFHAMSMESGLYDSHPGDRFEKCDADEALARQFTIEMGLGE